MKPLLKTRFLFVLALFGFSYGAQAVNKQAPRNLSAKEIFGNKNYQAIAYGAYRENTRDIQPTVSQIKEDLKILYAMNVRILRTYNTGLAEARNMITAIHELKKENPKFEMYMMVGVWINCENAWTAKPNHEGEDAEKNGEEVERAVKWANENLDVVKVIAIGNEAMVNWATSYFVRPKVILKWVNYLQNLKKEGKLPKDLWITCSDNYAAWGGAASYHTKDLEDLVKAVDFVSIHTYPMHETYYEPEFWYVAKSEEKLTTDQKINAAMERAMQRSISQYESVVKYVKSLGVNKPVHIGETGWATYTDQLYGNTGSKATDEYKSGIFYKKMRNWTNKSGISCFYFEAFDENWKDAQHPQGSENHFGLFTIDGKAKYPLWDLVDKGVFKGLKARSGKAVSKTYGGSKVKLMKDVMLPNVK